LGTHAFHPNQALFHLVAHAQKTLVFRQNHYFQQINPATSHYPTHQETRPLPTGKSELHGSARTAFATQAPDSNNHDSLFLSPPPITGLPLNGWHLSHTKHLGYPFTLGVKTKNKSGHRRGVITAPETIKKI